MKTISMRAENLALAEAFDRIPGDKLDLIDTYASDFRKIIMEFECAQGRVPTADDLIWIESQHHGRDITLAA